MVLCTLPCLERLTALRSASIAPPVNSAFSLLHSLLHLSLQSPRCHLQAISSQSCTVQRNCSCTSSCMSSLYLRSPTQLSSRGTRDPLDSFRLPAGVPKALQEDTWKNTEGVLDVPSLCVGEHFSSQPCHCSCQRQS